MYPGVAFPGCRLVRQFPHPWQTANHHGRFATTPKSRGGCFPARRTRLLGVPPTSSLRGCSGCYTLSADSHQPTSALRALVGLRSVPSRRRGGAGLGHFSPGAGHVFCVLGKKPSMEGSVAPATNVDPGRSACPVVSVPFGRQNPTLRRRSHACYLALPSSLRRGTCRCLAAFPLVVPPTLACRLGLGAARRPCRGLPLASSVGAWIWTPAPRHHPGCSLPARFV